MKIGELLTATLIKLLGHKQFNSDNVHMSHWHNKTKIMSQFPYPNSDGSWSNIRRVLLCYTRGDKAIVRVVVKCPLPTSTKPTELLFPIRQPQKHAVRHFIIQYVVQHFMFSSNEINIILPLIRNKLTERNGQQIPSSYRWIYLRTTISTQIDMRT